MTVKRPLLRDILTEAADTQHTAVLTWQEARELLDYVAGLERLAHPSVVVSSPVSACGHEWSDRGSPGDQWQECWLCGTTRDVTSSPGQSGGAS